MAVLKKVINSGTNLARNLIKIADIIRPHIAALVDLGIRVWILLVFWQSGIGKVADWDVALMLFEYEHPVPYLSPQIAAILGVGNEIIMPILLLIGFGSRFAAIALLFSTAIIQFTYMESHEHFLWALALLTIMVRGAGLYSLDFFIRTKFLPANEDIGRISRYIASLVVIMLTCLGMHEIVALIVDSVEPWAGSMIEFWSKIGK